MKGVSNALARLPIWWGRHSVQRAPLSTNGEQVGHYHPKFEGGKVVSAVVMPPQAHRELQGKQNKTKLVGHVCSLDGWRGHRDQPLQPQRIVLKAEYGDCG